MLPQEVTETIHGKVEQEREKILSTLCDLIRINTVNPYSGGRTVGSEKPGQAYLKPEYERLGLRTRLEPVPADVYQRAGVVGPSPRDFTDRPNLVAELEFSREGPHVLLFAHMDTVGVDEMTIPPFDPVRRDGRIYGRGSSDDKSSQAVALHAIRTLLDIGLNLRGKLTFASVVDEECDGGGAGIMALLLSGLKPDLALCLDGSGAFVGRGCQGVITGRIQVRGVSAHASSPDGVSALDKAWIVKGVLDGIRREREEAGAGLLNVGVLRAGSHPAMVPGAAEILFNLSYSQEEANEVHEAGHDFNGVLLRQRIERDVGRIASEDSFLRSHPPEISWVKDMPPFLTPKDSPLLEQLGEAYAQVTGRPPRVEIPAYWTDAAIVPLVSDSPVVGFGSGAGTAHSPDEWVGEETVIRHTKVLAQFLANSLRAAEPPAPANNAAADSLARQ